MPIKYVPFIPEPIEGQAVLGNFNRILRYKGADEVSMTLQRGMPLYEMERQETVGENADGNMVIRGGEKTKEFWDGTIQSEKQPLRLKIRNICGDETVWEVE